MKRIISLFVAIVICVSVFNCAFGVSATEQLTTTETQQTTSTETDEKTTEAVSSEETQGNISTEPVEGSTQGVTDLTEKTENSGENATVESSEETVESTEVTEKTEDTKPTEATQPTTAKVKKPKPVSGFKVAKKTSSSISLQWKKSKNATRYMLYRAVENIKTSKMEYSLYKTFTDEKRTSYTDKKVESGLIYKYKLYAGIKYKKKVVKSKPKSTSTFTPLKATSSLKVKKATTTVIKLDWSNIKNASKYEVYRKSENSSEYKKISTSPNSYFTDKNITSGLDYSYKIRGFRVANKKLRYSPFVTIATSAGVVSVGDIKAESYLNRGLFTWKPATGSDGYDIYVKKNNGKYTYKDTVTSEVYLTGKLTAGKTYTYQIKSFKKLNNQKLYSKAKTAKVNIVSTAYGKSAGNSYLEVCTETQTVYMYVNNKLIVKTPVVTGYYNVYDTTHGYHYIISKKTPATLKGSAGDDTWNVDVKYWLGFTYDGQGFHDSTWRYSGYGGSIYKYDGSHGCVNTPYDAMGKIFSKAYVGMPVIVY